MKCGDVGNNPFIAVKCCWLGLRRKDRIVGDGEMSYKTDFLSTPVKGGLIPSVNYDLQRATPLTAGTHQANETKTVPGLCVV